MNVGKRDYSEAEMMHMQREAEARVREMQNRTRQVAQSGEMATPRNRNWNSNPGMLRQRQQRRPQGTSQPRQTNPPPSPDTNRPDPVQESPGKVTLPTPEATAPPAKKDGTIIGDIMGALGLDEDYLLIIGLLLILINQRADTTLILALAYLLI